MGVAAIIPCKDEADRIAATVRAVRGIDGVDLVVVVDDGSTDETAARAHDAGAHVVRFGTNYPFHHVDRAREAMSARAAHAAGFAPAVDRKPMKCPINFSDRL